MLEDRKDVVAPVPNAETARFWSACNERRLMVKRCSACGKAHYYPRALCPHCFSVETEWEEVSGRGSIYAFSVMRRTETPFALALVTLDEGPTIMTNIIGCDADDIAIGRRVTVTFRPAVNGQLVAMFTPAQSE